MNFFATCPIGFGDLLETELRGFGAAIGVRTVAGIGFTGTLECAYRACLWSRIANRILLTVDMFDAADGDALYSGVQRTQWSNHLTPDNTLAVDFTTTRSRISHTLFGAQRVKDAIVDQLRDTTGARPDVDVHHPDLRINVHVQHDVASIAIDLSGESLHRRGYRAEGGPAPLKENLAAALLLRAGWPGIAAEGGALLDPLCGSGTLPIEALTIAADIAPNLARSRFGFSNWRGHEPALWRSLHDEAAARRVAGLARCRNLVHGSDADPRAVAASLANAACAGLAEFITFETCALADITAPAAHGLLITNPPYGERLADSADLPQLFTDLGAVLRSRFNGWRAAVLAPDEELGFLTRLRLTKKNVAKNGAIDVVLLSFDVAPDRVFAEHIPGKVRPPRTLDPGIDAFRNRIGKNLKHIARWARQNDISCYRIYDADLPDYAFAVDLYRDDLGITWLHVQEYAPPATVDERRAQLRRDSVLDVLPALVDVAPDHICFKTRERKRGTTQYERQDDTAIFHEVREGGCLLRVNLRDYLDTGLFLDHRPLRLRIQRESRGRRFLNLFAYTGAATVHAVRGGAVSCTSVDLSNTYLDWARRNLLLNDVDLRRHELIRDDCSAWLVQAARRGDQFDLMLVDPPSFSNSKGAEHDFDVQRDHVALIRACAALLAVDGTMYFSTNLRRFKFDSEALSDLRCEDITRSTIDEDFRRNTRIHSCWRIRRQLVGARK
jgi:23S rRNA (guanine2445-N2)-methyltransferase / 23S rRNA (guanine2069-N7)-methyltransferase